MRGMSYSNPINSISFATPDALYRWLRRHHAMETELWVKYYKKATGRKSIVWEEAVCEALCWGWIDGIRKRLDDVAFVQRFTPRRKRSHWSDKNCETARGLIAAGRMEEPGLACVREAIANGNWKGALPNR